ncbi:MAG: biosynthetic-type acetolactate synthase large subunit [Oscillospiraceae bacterium]|nr:biosynthetic-type acetolactate synthase large subunit [Oscillospiraceae bacterium]
MISGAQIMINCLLAENITTVFGYPGAAIAPFYDALCGSGIRHILARTEQGAGHSANGYARITGRPGVCVVTSGPGATNLLTALATAYSDSIPLIAITGQAATNQLGRDVFQEVDTTGAAAAFVKYCYLLKSPEDIPRVFKETFYIASTGRKGPVLIDAPVDVQQMNAEPIPYPENISIRGYKPVVKGHPLQITKAAKAIQAAQKPLICCGGGVISSGAGNAVREFCEETGIPAVSTMMGIGAMPPNHPAYFGMVGQNGTAAANTAVRESDLLVLIGARVGDRAISRPQTLESHADIVHIDIDTAEIGKNLGTTIPIVGDAAEVIAQIREKNITGNWSAWRSRLEEIRRNDTLCECKAEPLHSISLIKSLCDMLPGDSIYTADVGLNQILSARGFSLSGPFLTTGGMGTMGYSIPAAIGAKIAAPDKTVLAVCGDGAFQMSQSELATMNQHSAPIKIIVMNNKKLGMVADIQKTGFKNKNFAVDLSGGPDLALIAKAYSIPYLLAQTWDDVPKMQPLLNSESPCLIEIR